MLHLPLRKKSHCLQSPEKWFVLPIDGIEESTVTGVAEPAAGNGDVEIEGTKGSFTGSGAGDSLGALPESSVQLALEALLDSLPDPAAAAAQ